MLPRALLVVLLVVPCVAAPALDLADRPGLEKLLQERIAGTTNLGVVVGIVTPRSTNIVTAGSSGNNSVPLNGRSIFEIGSITKAFTGVLLSDMVRRSEVKVTEPISATLPASVKTPRRAGKQIRLLDLATHRSGLPRLPRNLKPRNPANPYADYTISQLYQFLGSYELPRDIGAEYEYSNLGFGLLGHILGLQAGRQYEALIVERICRPLGMHDTAIQLNAEQKERLVPGHLPNGQPVMNWDLPSLAGAGALRSTVDDLITFLGANLGFYRTGLKPALDRAHEPLQPAGNAQNDMGLGWHIRKEGGPIVWHNGQTGGYHSFIGFNPRRNVGVVMLVNAGSDLDDIGFHLLDERSPLKRTAAVAALPAETFERVMGQFEVAPGFTLTLRRDGKRLLAVMTGQEEHEIFPASKSELFYKVVEARITFDPETAGPVPAIKLHQSGQTVTANRVSTNTAERVQPKTVALEAKALAPFAGEYQIAPNVLLTVTAEGTRLFTQVTGQPKVEVFPEGTNRFFYKVVEATLEFQNDESSITNVVLRQGGRTLSLKKR